MLGESASGRLATTSQLTEMPIRLRNVPGFQNRANDVIFCPPLVRHNEEATAVVFFGGDVQDYSENMETNRDSKSYIKYNLDATALLLRSGFPKAHIAVVRPARMEFKTFSCFDNFVRGNNAGVPDHTPMHHSLQHLEKLLHAICQRLLSMAPVTAASITTVTVGNGNAGHTSNAAATNTAISSNHSHDAQEMDIDILQVQETVTMDTNGTIVYPDKDETTTGSAIDQSDSGASSSTATDRSTAEVAGSSTSQQTAAGSSSEPTEPEDPLWWCQNLNLDKCKLTLIGFSKGCVVLNQFIYEFHYLKTLTPDDFTMIRLLSRIKDMYWLDGGHGGAKNTWITSRSLLETLTRLAIQVHVHVTPYQVQDERRPWIRREEKTFVDLLRRLGAPLQRCLHFDSSVANLFTHFEVLQVFRQPCPSLPAAHISPTKDGDDEK